MSINQNKIEPEQYFKFSTEQRLTLGLTSRQYELLNYLYNHVSYFVVYAKVAAKHLGCSYRTVLRELQVLKEKGLAACCRLRASGGRFGVVRYIGSTEPMSEQQWQDYISSLNWVMILDAENKKSEIPIANFPPKANDRERLDFRLTNGVFEHRKANKLIAETTDQSLNTPPVKSGLPTSCQKATCRKMYTHNKNKTNNQTNKNKIYKYIYNSGKDDLRAKQADEIMNTYSPSDKVKIDLEMNFSLTAQFIDDQLHNYRLANVEHSDEGFYDYCVKQLSEQSSFEQYSGLTTLDLAAPIEPEVVSKPKQPEKSIRELTRAQPSRFYTGMTPFWYPADWVLEYFDSQSIPRGLAESLLPGFIAYWMSSPNKPSSYDQKFKNFVSFSWKKEKLQDETLAYEFELKRKAMREKIERQNKAEIRREKAQTETEYHKQGSKAKKQSASKVKSITKTKQTTKTQETFLNPNWEPRDNTVNKIAKKLKCPLEYIEKQVFPFVNHYVNKQYTNSNWEAVFGSWVYRSWEDYGGKYKSDAPRTKDINLGETLLDGFLERHNITDFQGENFIERKDNLISFSDRKNGKS